MLATLLFLAAATHHSPPTKKPVKPAPVELSQSVRNSIMAKIALDLDVPSSAVYVWPKRSDSLAYCGFVRAKSRTGADMGWSQFIAFINQEGKAMFIQILEKDSTGAAKTVMGGKCRESGYPDQPQ